MNRRQLRVMHKWRFFFMGAFILMWCISGMLMILPGWWFGATNRTSLPPVDMHNITLSPSQAIARLEEDLGGRLDIRNMQI